MFLEHCKIPPKYIVLFKGDDSDFDGNQEIAIDIDTQLSLEGVKAHFRFLDFSQDFDAIPEDRRLLLVFPRESTRKFPLGAMDATLTFEDAQGRTRTVANRIHIVVTNSVGEAYWNEDPQAITVVMSGDEYLKNAEVSDDGKTLTITKKDGTEVQFRGGGGSGGAVDSVNGKTGAVLLTGADIKTSETDTQTISAKLSGKQDALTDDQKAVLNGGPYLPSTNPNFSGSLSSMARVLNSEAPDETVVDIPCRNGSAEYENFGSFLSVKTRDATEDEKQSNPYVSEDVKIVEYNSGGVIDYDDLGNLHVASIYDIGNTCRFSAFDLFEIKWNKPDDGETLPYVSFKLESAYNAFGVAGRNKVDFGYGSVIQAGPSIKKQGKEVATEEQVTAVSDKVDDIKSTVSTDNRFLVNDTTAAIQTRENEGAEWVDQIRVDKGYDALTGSTMVKLDKSVQTVTVNGGSLTVELPDEVEGTVRDLCLYVNNSSDADTALTFPAGTYYGDDPNGAVAKAGKVTAIYLTEIPKGAWMLRIEELEQHEVVA